MSAITGSIKNNFELASACHAVLSRLDGDPTSSQVWETIRECLSKGAAYAKRMRDEAKRREDDES